MPALDALRRQDYAKTDLVGIVVNNRDPKMARRLQVRVPVIHDDIPDEHLPWAMCATAAGRGPNELAARLEIPHIGSDVAIKFQQGDPQNPMYTGGVSSARTVPALFRTNYPERSGWLVPIGTHFYVDEVSKTLHLQHQGTTVDIAVDGKVVIKAPEILVDCPMTTYTGHVVVQQGISGSMDCVFDNVSLVNHTHPSAPPGPVSKPTPGA